MDLELLDIGLARDVVTPMVFKHFACATLLRGLLICHRSITTLAVVVLSSTHACYTAATAAPGHPLSHLPGHPCPSPQAYVTNLNAALEKYHKAEASGNVAEMIALQQSIRFNGASPPM